MKNITIVVPIYNLTGKRLRNFEKIKQSLLKLDCFVVIAEQVSESGSDAFVAGKSNVIHKKILINSDVFHKTKLLNEATEHIITKHIWFLDADIYLDYNKILELIDNQHAIKPFSQIYYLNDEETQNIVDTGSLKIKNQEIREIITRMGPFTFILRKEIFEKIGKFNENFIGYGWEDIEITDRIKKECEIAEFPIKGLHFFHEPTIENSENAIFYNSLKS